MLLIKKYTCLTKERELPNLQKMRQLLHNYYFFQEIRLNQIHDTRPDELTHVTEQSGKLTIRELRTLE